MNKNLLIFLLKNGKGHGLNIITAILASIIVTVCGIINVDIIRRLVDTYAADLQSTETFKLVAIIIVVVVTGVIFKYLLRINTQNYSLSIVYNIRKKVIYKLLHAKMIDLDNIHSGDIIGTLNNNLGTIEAFTSDQLMNYITVPLTLVLSITFLTFVNWQLMVVSFISTPIAMVVVHFITKPISHYAEKYYTIIGKENSLVSDTVEGLVTIKTFSMQNMLLGKYKGLISLSKKQGLKMDFRNIIVLPLVIIMNELPYIICAIYGGFMAVNGKITPGGLIAFLQLLRMMIGPTTQIMSLITSYRGAAGAAKRLFELLNMQEENSGRCLDTNLDENVYVKFNNIEFEYRENMRVLDHVSFHLNACEKVAFVGESGAGKSTIIDLICRLYVPQSGEVYFWGQNAEEINPDSIRENISVVSQNPYIFSGTVEENIRYGCPDASKDEVINAAKQAQIHSYIESLPDQYRSIVQENGNTMSGGQKQRLAIARALLRKSKIIILDEPTSSLDYKTEKSIMEEIYTLFQSSLIIIVTHRLSTIKYCDRIFVVKSGTILETGDLNELIQLKGQFYKLYAGQMLEENEI